MTVFDTFVLKWCDKIYIFRHSSWNIRCADFFCMCRFR